MSDATAAQDTLPPIVLGVPGRWKDGDELAQRLAAAGGGYLLEGESILNVATRRTFALKVVPREPRLDRLFALAGQGRVPREDIEKLKKHTCSVYVTGPGGSRNAAKEMLRLGSALMKAGGIAVKVQSS